MKGIIFVFLLNAELSLATDVFTHQLKELKNVCNEKLFDPDTG